MKFDTRANYDIKKAIEKSNGSRELEWKQSGVTQENISSYADRISRSPILSSYAAEVSKPFLQFKNYDAGKVHLESEKRMKSFTEKRNTASLSIAKTNYDAEVGEINAYYDTEVAKIENKYKSKYAGLNQDYSDVDQIALNNEMAELNTRRQDELDNAKKTYDDLVTKANNGELISVDMGRQDASKKRSDEVYNITNKALENAAGQSLEGKISLEDLKKIYLGEKDIFEVSEDIRPSVINWVLLKTGEEQAYQQIDQNGYGRKYNNEYIARLKEAQNEILPGSNDVRGKISYQIGNLTRGMTGGVEDALRYGYVSSGWEKKTSAKVMAQSGLEEKLSQDEVQRYLDAARNVYGVEVEIHPDAQYSKSELELLIYDAVDKKAISESWTGEWQKKADQEALALPSDQRTGQFVSSLGRIVPATLLTVASEGTAAPATIYTFASSAGSATRDAYNESGNIDAAISYGRIKGLVEAGIERLGGLGVPGMEGKLGDVLEKIANKVATKLGASEGGAAVMRFLANATEEGLEEVLSEIVDPILKRWTYDPSAPDASLEQLIEAFAGGFGAAGVYSGAYSAATGGKAFRSANTNTDADIDIDTNTDTDMQNGPRPVLPETDISKITPNNAESQNVDIKTVPNGEFTDLSASGNEKPDNTPVKAGRVTRIFQPYEGDVPINEPITSKNKRPVTISDQSVQAASDIVLQAEQSDAPARTIKERIKGFKDRITGNVRINGVVFDGKPYEAQISSRAITKMISDGHYTGEKISVLQNLQTIVRNGEYVGSGRYGKDKAKAQRVIRYDYFETPVTFPSGEKIVSFDVEVYQNQNNVRTYRINDIEITDQNGGTKTEPTVGFADLTAGDGFVGPKPTAAAQGASSSGLSTEYKASKPYSENRTGQQSALSNNNIQQNGDLVNKTLSVSEANARLHRIQNKNGLTRADMNDARKLADGKISTGQVRNQQKLEAISNAASAYLSLDTATLSQKADQERVTASPILRAEEAMPWEYDQSFGDKVKSGASKTYRDLVSDQAEGEKLARIQEKKRKGAVTQAESYQMVRNAPAISQNIIDGRLSDIDGNEIGESYSELVKSMPGNMDAEFQTYLVHRLNAERRPQGKAVVAESEKESAQYVREAEAANPEFAEAAKRYYDWWDKFMRAYAVKSGRVSLAEYEHLRELYPSYVPIIRANYAGLGTPKHKRTLSSASIVKTADGGVSPILDLRDASAIKIQQIVKSSLLNQSYTNLYDFVKTEPEASAMYARVAAEDADGPDVDAAHDILFEDGADNKEVSKNERKDNKGAAEVRAGVYKVRAYIDGKPVDLYVNQGIYDGYSKLSSPSAGNSVLNLAGKITGVSKQLITQKNPFFAVRNVVRDLQAYFDFSEADAYHAAKNYGKAIKLMAKNDVKWQQYQALGGTSSGMIANGKSYAARFDADDSASGKIKKAAQKTGEMAGKILEKPGQITEQIPRFAEYLNALEKYGDTPEGRRKAILASADVTVNFSRGGSTSKAIGKAVPYFNAQVQGLDKLVRQAKNHPVRFVARNVIRGGVISAILNELLGNSDNEHYKDLNDRMKNTYFLIPNYAGELDENGKPKTFIKMRKSESASMFGSLLETVIRVVEGEEDAGTGLSNWAGDIFTNIAPANPIKDTIIQPIINLASNKDFAGRTIVPEAMEDLSPKYQYDSTTSSIAKALGEATGWSPKQIDYIIKSFGGDFVSAGLALTSDSKKGANPLENSFVADPRYSSKPVDDFYTGYDEAKRAAADRKFEEEIPDSVETPEDAKERSYQESSKEISSLRREEQKLMEDKSLPPAQRKEKINDLREKINRIASGAEKKADQAYADRKKIWDDSGLTVKQMEDLAGMKADKDPITGRETASAEEKRGNYVRKLKNIGDEETVYKNFVLTPGHREDYEKLKDTGIGAKGYYLIQSVSKASDKAAVIESRKGIKDKDRLYTELVFNDDNNKKYASVKYTGLSASDYYKVSQTDGMMEKSKIVSAIPGLKYRDTIYDTLVFTDAAREKYKAIKSAGIDLDPDVFLNVWTAQSERKGDSTLYNSKGNTQRDIIYGAGLEPWQEAEILNQLGISQNYKNEWWRKSS